MQQNLQIKYFMGYGTIRRFKYMFTLEESKSLKDANMYVQAQCTSVYVCNYYPSVITNRNKTERKRHSLINSCTYSVLHNTAQHERFTLRSK